jgi:hypothetical protein
MIYITGNELLDKLIEVISSLDHTFDTDLGATEHVSLQHIAKAARGQLTSKDRQDCGIGNIINLDCCMKSLRIAVADAYRAEIVGHSGEK